MKAWRFFNYYLSRSCDRIYFKDLENNLILTRLSKKNNRDAEFCVGQVSRRSTKNRDGKKLKQKRRNDIRHKNQSALAFGKKSSTMDHVVALSMRVPATCYFGKTQKI